jgi:hypothetical protein
MADQVQPFLDVSIVTVVQVNRSVTNYRKTAASKAT